MSLKLTQKSLKKPPGYRDPNLPIQRPSPTNAPNLPPTFYTYKKKRKNWCKTCCFCFCISLLLLIILLISLVGLFYVWYDPKLPEFNVKSFELDQFNITPSSDGPTLNTRFKANIEFKNTNKKIKLVYNKIYMVVNGDQGGLNLGEETKSGFVQGRNNVTNVKFVLEGKQLVSEKEGKDLREKFKNKSLKITTEISSGIGMVLNGINTGTVGLKLLCGPSTLKQIQNGPKSNCKLFIFRLFYV